MFLVDIVTIISGEGADSSNVMLPSCRRSYAAFVVGVSVCDQDVGMHPFGNVIRMFAPSTRGVVLLSAFDSTLPGSLPPNSTSIDTSCGARSQIASSEFRLGPVMVRRLWADRSVPIAPERA